MTSRTRVLQATPVGQAQGLNSSMARRTGLRTGIWFCVVIGLSTLWYGILSSSVIVRAERALGRGDLREAFLLAAQELKDRPDSDRALMVAGSAALALRDPISAVAYFGRVSDRNPALIGLSRRETGLIALNAGRPTMAEELLQKSLLSAPSDSTTHDRLIYLFTLEGRHWEARELILHQLRAGVVTRNYLVIAGQHHSNLENAQQYAKQCTMVVPDDPVPRLIQAIQDQRDNQPHKARKLVEQVLEKRPHLSEAQAILCLILAENGTSEEFEQAYNRLPSNAPMHPDIWLSRGIWAERQGQLEAAARCYWESLLMDPNLARSNYRLSQILVALGLPDQARPFGERAQELTKLSLKMSLLANELGVNKLPEIVHRLETLGRFWEAAGWCQVVLQETGRQPEWARAMQTRLHRQLLTCRSFTVPSLDPSRKIDLSYYPLPSHNNGGRSPGPPPETLSARIAFKDDAADTGISFTYWNGADQGDLESMLEMNGGGVAVLDYDGDDWPDVFFTQGGALPPAPFDSAQSDQLFRNRGGEPDPAAADPPFQNVTEAAGLRDVGYGQGVTVGDFDNDGFPDLYVGNIGVNQLYRNNGDGTFTDVTTASGTQAGGWSSSCVFADFNHDGLPDLYVVTYLGGEAPYRPCSKRATVRCSPLNYVAAPDRFYLNLGDGRFQDLTEGCGLAAPEGRGLGVVAADFDGSGRLSLFVANDMSANFFFLNQTRSPDKIQFQEQALLSGLAYDNQGQAKAGMGIAAGDFDGNERLDLFVTNFYRQSKDLYVQQSDGSFHELSREAKLFAPSFFMLGWGTQFLDGDLDGHPDLIIANGHVHDPLDPKIPYQMPAQFFRNLGDGTFLEIASGQLGEFFKRKLLGRSLARLDWNRDGREDVCILHLNDPVALLTNRTDNSGSSLSIRLVGVESARDAIGARVRVSIGDKTWTRQLTAGDGFHASNERQLVFGLGSHKTADSVEILWPSGLRQIFQNLELNREWLLIEHRPTMEVLLRFRQPERSVEMRGEAAFFEDVASIGEQ